MVEVQVKGEVEVEVLCQENPRLELCLQHDIPLVQFVTLRSYQKISPVFV